MMVSTAAVECFALCWLVSWGWYAELRLVQLVVGVELHGHMSLVCGLQKEGRVCALCVGRGNMQAGRQGLGVS